MEAFDFWNRVDEKNPYKTVKQLSESCGIEYNRVKKNRSDVRLPNLEDTYAIAIEEGVSIEYLLTGIEFKPRLHPRLQAIVDWLQEDERRIGSLEQLIFGEKAGQSSDFSKREA